MCVTSGALSDVGCFPRLLDFAPCACLHSAVVPSGALVLSFTSSHDLLLIQLYMLHALDSKPPIQLSAMSFAIHPHKQMNMKFDSAMRLDDWNATEGICGTKKRSID
jgi:hypothetical protein